MAPLALIVTVAFYDLAAIVFLALFLALSIVFTVSQVLWPVSLIIFGISLLSISYFANSQSKRVQ